MFATEKHRERKTEAPWEGFKQARRRQSGYDGAIQTTKMEPERGKEATGGSGAALGNRWSVGEGAWWPG